MGLTVRYTDDNTLCGESKSIEEAMNLLQESFQKLFQWPAYYQI